jgi:hypothetical protein
MNRWGSFFSRFLALFRGRRLDDDLATELHSHLAMLTDEYVRRGMNPEEARYAARRDFGGLEQAKELYRDQRGLPFLESLLQDVRYAFRMLRKSPGFTAVALLTLALGIGANTAIFSLLDTLFFRRLPVQNSSQLVYLFQTRNHTGYASLSYPDYLYYRDHNRSLSQLAAHYSFAPINLVANGESKEINGSVVTANYFSLLRLQPALGRFFSGEEDAVPDRNPVAVLSYTFWRNQFAGAPNVLGKPIQLNGVQFTIVGVAPKDFHGVYLGGLATEVWMPSSMLRVGYRFCDGFQRNCTIMELIGSLRPGQTLAATQAEMDVLARDLETAYPDIDKGLGIVVMPARGTLPGNEDPRAASLLMGFVGVVLLVACANLAGLLLARNSVRRKEVAVRLAMGAYFDLSFDPLILCFAFGISLLTGIVFGLVPAFQTTRPDLMGVLKDETSLKARHGSFVRNALIIAQVALSNVLLVGAGLLLLSLHSIYQGSGFDPRPILTLRLRPTLAAYNPARSKAFQLEVIRRLETLPGVLAASPARFVPLPGWGAGQLVSLPGREAAEHAAGYAISTNDVGPRFFEALGVPLIEGRDFTNQDQKNTPLVAIVNEVLARKLWPGQEAVGRTVVFKGKQYQIVGVVKQAQYYAASQQPEPFLYADFWQTDGIDVEPVDTRLHVRVAGDTLTMLRLVRREIAAVDANVPISEDRPLTEWLDYSFQPVRIAGTLLVCFAALALFLSAIGLYGVLAFSVAQRTREIGIRMALGAEKTAVATLILRQGLYLAAAGVAFGLVGAFACARLLGNLLYGVHQFDLSTFLAGPAVLLAIALAACYLPARRASRLDPLVALRYE